MSKRVFLFAVILSGLLSAFPKTGVCNGVVRTFDYFADLFNNGQTVWVQIQYYKKFGDNYRIIGYSPDKVTIQNGRYEVLIPSRYYYKDTYLELIFDAGYVTPKVDLFPPSNYTPKTVYILLGALFIAIVSRIRFNRWTQKNDGKYAFLPRSFTTWPRFIRSALLYVAVIEVFYFIVIYSPETIIFIDKYLGGGHIDYDILNEMGQYSVLWSIFLLTGVLPNFPWVCKWETNLRDVLQGYAFIPSEAKAVISQLKINYAAFKPDDKIIELILPRIGADVFSREDFHDIGDSIDHKWCKLSYLKNRLVDWMTYPRIDKFFTLSKNNFDMFLTEYDRIQSEIEKYFGYQNMQNNGREQKEVVESLNGLLNANRTKLNDDLESHLNKAYNFICIGILGTEKMHNGRKKAFRFFGLEPFIPERNKIDWDTNIKTIGVLVSAVFLPTLLYYIMSKYGSMKTSVNYFPKDATAALFWSLVGIAMHALTIIVVVFFDQWRARVLTSMYDEVRSGEPPMPHRLSNDVIAGMIGFLVGFLILEGLIFIGHYADLTKASQVFVDKIPDNALWSLLPAVTGFFIQYYLNTFRTQAKKAWWLGLRQGLIMSAAAALVTFLVIDQKISEILPFILYAAFTCFWVGMGVGYVFPNNYLKKINKHHLIEDRRRNVRANVMEPVTVYVDGSRYACNIVNISSEGAKIDRAFRFPTGSHARIDAAQLGKLNSIIVRKVKTGTIIKFPYLDDSAQGQITAYLDKYAG